MARAEFFRSLKQAALKDNMGTAAKFHLNRSQWALCREHESVIHYNGLLFHRDNVIKAAHAKAWDQRYSGKTTEYIHHDMAMRARHTGEIMTLMSRPEPGKFVDFDNTALSLATIELMSSHLLMYASWCKTHQKFNPDDYLEMFV